MTTAPPPTLPPGLRLSPAVLEAREKLAQGRAKLRAQHDAGSPGVQVCTLLTELTDKVVLDLFGSALLENGDETIESVLTLVPYGGYGRCDLAPYSDVDLMVLHAPGALARVTPLVKRFSQHLYDSGVEVGFSLRTPAEACSLAMKDVTIFTSLVESRYLAGNKPQFEKFIEQFRRRAKRRASRLIRDVEKARREERQQFGETVYLLKPNVKRSRGGLRDLQFLRWVGFARHGETELDGLFQAGWLTEKDRGELREAREFLLRLRNEMHFHAGKAQDVLERPEQVRLAERYGYEGNEAILPVEKFMRDYFLHTSQVRYVVTHFAERAQTMSPVQAVLGKLFSLNIDRDYRLGPRHITAKPRGLAKLRGNLEEVLRLMELANLHDRRIDHRTWEAIRQSMTDSRAMELSTLAAKRFLDLISQPGRLGELLRRLHELRALEHIVPGMAHAHGLVQFNDYHKFTVDEHCIRAVECATEFQNDEGPIGEAYRGIRQKHLLHLALLIHDLGKGFLEDHSEVGRRLAIEAGVRFRLPQRDTEVVAMLVHKHLVMSDLAQRRDINDLNVILQLAQDTGSPDVLQMLYVLTCADWAAVGPGVLNQWKLQLLTELYRRTLQQLAGDTSLPNAFEQLRRRREEILNVNLRLTTSRASREPADAWLQQQIEALPHGYLLNNSPETIRDDLRQLRQRPANAALAWSRYFPEHKVVEYTIAAHEDLTPGIFHKLTGAVSSQGHQILSAEINTLDQGQILDRFVVHDLDFADEPPPGRREEVCRALEAALQDQTGTPPTFRRMWQSKRVDAELTRRPTLVRTDSSTSERYTLIDIFAHDRLGLLYTITRTIFELHLSVHVAKIGTHLDQVVDVFYVTDINGEKIQDEARLADIRQRLLEAIEKV